MELRPQKPSFELSMDSIVRASSPFLEFILLKQKMKQNLAIEWTQVLMGCACRYRHHVPRDHPGHQRGAYLLFFSSCTNVAAF